MMKVIDEGINACLPCGEDLEGALIDFEVERNEEKPKCDFCTDKEKKGKR